jgi:hypothetical protein
MKHKKKEIKNIKMSKVTLIFMINIKTKLGENIPIYVLEKNMEI